MTKETPATTQVATTVSSPSARSVQWRSGRRDVRVRQRARPHAAGPASRPAPATDLIYPADVEPRQFLTMIGSELAVITGLLYYFGWARTRAQAESLGFPSGVINLSTADYLLKSVNFLVPLLIALLLLLILGHVAFIGILRRRRTGSSHQHHLGRFTRAAKVAAFAGVVGGVLGSLPPWNNRFSLPVGLTIAVLFAISARTLQRRLAGRDPWSTPRRWMITLLLTLLVFWDTERVATFFGEQFAADYKARPEQFSAIIIYSKDDLRLEAEGVKAEKLGDAEDSYRYRYTGLHVMESATDRYVLINGVWADGRGRLFVISRSDTIRVELVGRT
jgi:hypothetical protein